MANGLWPDLATWRGPTPNTGPAMREQRGMVVHIAEGYYEGTIAWQKNATADVSSHFVIAGPKDVPRGTADGKIAQVVDCDIAAWTQRAGNGSWVSAENCGFAPDKLSAAQIESNAQLFARGHTDYGWPLQLAGNPNGRGLGYHSMGSNEGTCNWTGANWGHCACPGKNIIAQLPLIVERAKEIVSGTVADYTEAQMRGFAWQYNGRGLTGNDLTPEGNVSTLQVLDATWQGMLALQKEQQRQSLVLAEILSLLKAGGGSAPVVFPSYTINGTATPAE